MGKCKKVRADTTYAVSARTKGRNEKKESIIVLCAGFPSLPKLQRLRRIRP